MSVGFVVFSVGKSPRAIYSKSGALLLNGSSHNNLDMSLEPCLEGVHAPSHSPSSRDKPGCSVGEGEGVGVGVWVWGVG